MVQSYNLKYRFVAIIYKFAQNCKNCTFRFMAKYFRNRINNKMNYQHLVHILYNFLHNTLLISINCNHSKSRQSIISCTKYIDFVNYIMRNYRFNTIIIYNTNKFNFTKLDVTNPNKNILSSKLYIQNLSQIDSSR